MNGNRPVPRPFELDPAASSTVVEEVKAEQALAETVSADPAAVAEPAPKRGWSGRLLGLFTLGAVGAGVIQAIDYVRDMLVTDALLGVPFAVFLTLVLVSATAFTLREVADLRRLSRRAHVRQTAERIAASELHGGEAEALLAPLGRQFAERPTLAGRVAEFQSHRHDAMSDGELLRLFERKVLAPVDGAAYRLVLESSRDVGLLTALSPLGLLDGVLVLWRTTILFRSIARLYGMAPGPLTTFRLLKNSIRNAALAGIADVVTHAAVEHVGAGLLAMLSARAGQGAGNSLLHARLGIEAMRQCRPLPFMAEEPPRLSSVRKALFDNGGNIKERPKLR